MAITDNTAKWQVKKITNFTDKEREIATQAQAEEGVDNTKIMTPLRAKNAIDKQRPMRTFTSFQQLGLSNETVTLQTLSQALAAKGGNALLKTYVSKDSYPLLDIPDGGFFTAYCLTGSMVMEIQYHDSAYKYIGGYVSSSNKIIWDKVFTKGDIATQAEAEVGTNNTKVMTPLRTKNVIDAFAVKLRVW